jgi:L-threonylcarbamoyladenylate synthase
LKNLIASDNTLGIRIVKELLFQINGKMKRPLVSTSANISGQPTPKVSKKSAQDYQRC